MVRVRSPSRLSASPKDSTRSLLPGLITADGLGVICDRLEEEGGRGVTLIFDDPFRLLLAGEPVRIGTMLRWLDELAVRIAYRRSTHLAAFTFNPYYPAFDGTTYSSAYLDAAGSRATLAAALKTPVIDVKMQGGEARIYDACFNSDI